MLQGKIHDIASADQELSVKNLAEEDEGHILVDDLCPAL